MKVNMTPPLPGAPKPSPAVKFKQDTAGNIAAVIVLAAIAVGVAYYADSHGLNDDWKGIALGIFWLCVFAVYSAGAWVTGWFAAPVSNLVVLLAAGWVVSALRKR